MENINEKDGMGFTPLIRACAEGNLDLTKSLIEKYADIEAKNNDGRTALMWACENGSVEIVSFLIGKGANLNVKDNQGLTALCTAAQNGHFTIVKLLVENGANIRYKANDAVLAIAEAQKGGYEQIVQYLEERLENIPISGNCDLHKTMKAVTYCKDCGNLMCEKCTSLAPGYCPACALKFYNRNIFYLQEWLRHTKFSLRLSASMWGVIIGMFILVCFMFSNYEEPPIVLAGIVFIAWIIAGAVLPSHFEHNLELITKVDMSDFPWYMRLIPHLFKLAFYVIISPILIIIFFIAYKRKKRELEGDLVQKASFEAAIANPN